MPHWCASNRTPSAVTSPRAPRCTQWVWWLGSDGQYAELGVAHVSWTAVDQVAVAYGAGHAERGVGHGCCSPLGAEAVGGGEPRDLRRLVLLRILFAFRLGTPAKVRSLPSASRPAAVFSRTRQARPFGQSASSTTWSGTREGGRARGGASAARRAASAKVEKSGGTGRHHAFANGLRPDPADGPSWTYGPSLAEAVQLVQLSRRVPPLCSKTELFVTTTRFPETTRTP